MIDETEEMGEKASIESKHKKVKERTIGQAIQAVRTWRRLYDTADQQGRRMYTLEEAARKVQVLKKTLDDYFVQIRIALQFSFNA